MVLASFASLAVKLQWTNPQRRTTIADETSALQASQHPL
jgi:hypothetical protein